MGRRLGARLIDGVAISILYFILSTVGFASAMDSAKGLEDCGQYSDPGYQACINNQVEAADDLFAAVFGFALIFFLATLLYEWLMISFAGATLGKMALGLKVVKESTGQAPGLGISFIRWVVPVAGSIACGVGQILVYVSPFFDNSGKLQGWHDRAAHTLVIKK
ncbi:RDD family protein [Streptomyces sp. NPDC058661]